MTLAIPKLDDRQFQDIVDEAKKRIPHYCKEWTDHNLSDPGVTLIELFAWMTDIILYRLNRVPDLHYIKFMEMLGITLAEPVPAKVPVTFWLSAPQATPVTIPAGTEVASTQTELEPSTVFTTDENLLITPPDLSMIFSRVLTRQKTKMRFNELNLNRLVAGFVGEEIFSKTPNEEEALYFGFETDPSHHILRFDVDFDPAFGRGVVPTLPPYVWEFSVGYDDKRWETCEVEFDETDGLNNPGRIQIHLDNAGKLKVNNQEKFWVRVRIKEISETEAAEGMKPFSNSPRLRKVNVTAMGGTVPATHAQVVKNEFLGRSDGTPGQRLYLQNTPILHREAGDTLILQIEGEPEETWEERVDFADSKMDDRHFTLDAVSGEIRLGPAVRQPDGAVKLYGAIPPRNANLVFRRYRYGGGQDGNVQQNFLNTLKTAIPYIEKVRNRETAWGGLDPETLEAAMVRAPAMLRSRERAVTSEDYEFLAKRALPAVIGRVKCIQPLHADASQVNPGLVYVLVIPRVAEPAGFISVEELALDDNDIDRLAVHLDERRLLTTRVDIRPPAYHWVSAQVELRASPGADQKQIEQDVLQRLHRFLNPLVGGMRESGWAFGRDLFVSDVYQCLQGLPDVQFVREVQMFEAEPGGDAKGSAVESIKVHSHGVIASGNHTVNFI